MTSANSAATSSPRRSAAPSTLINSGASLLEPGEDEDSCACRRPCSARSSVSDRLQRLLDAIRQSRTSTQTVAIRSSSAMPTVDTSASTQLPTAMRSMVDSSAPSARRWWASWANVGSTSALRRSGSINRVPGWPASRTGKVISVSSSAVLSSIRRHRYLRGDARRPCGDGQSRPGAPRSSVRAAMLAQRSIIICGGVGAGKTTLLRAVAVFDILVMSGS